MDQHAQHRRAPDGTVIINTTCDRCRAHKVKCDGKYPCRRCLNRYKKLKSVEGIDVAEFGCLYTPAKRRGPVPGKAAARKMAVERDQVPAAATGPQKTSDAVNNSDESSVTLNRLDSFSIDSHSDVLALKSNVPVSLRSWIAKALHLIVDTNGKRAPSQVYLQLALKIAKSLAEQILHAEELYDQCGTSDELHFLSLSAGQDWAKYVTVQLDSSLGPFSDEFNAELESLLECSERGVPAGREELQQFTTESGEKGEVKHKTANFKESDAGSSGAESLVDQIAMELAGNCLDIISARIQCCEGKCISQGDSSTANQSSQRIYYLGLVFYELFSGKIPPENLKHLALCENAFDSLSTLTLVDQNDQDPSPSVCNKRHEGSALSSGDNKLCELSCEYLRLAGIPSFICDMIFNMLDSVYGDFSGKEAYMNMTDVAIDLQLMIDRPSKFLRGLDSQLPMSGLPIHEVEIPREEEFEAIKSCYKRSIARSGEFGIIQGESGTGKSWLAYRFGKFVISGGGLFLTGKFDQMRQDHAEPFSALASAFDQYCELLLDLRKKDSVTFKPIVDNLNATLGPDVSPLLKMIPRLKTILGERVGLEYDDSAADANWGNSFSRLKYLISQFIKVISTNSCVSMVLLLDDLQWIDEASLSILRTILRQKHEKFFFLGCCRDDEMANDHSFWKMMDDIEAEGVNATQVKLSCMNEETLKTVVSDLLCVSPRLVKSLSSVVFNRTKGNVLFCFQLMLLLYRNGVLCIDLCCQRWKWDDDKIVSMKLPDNIAICLANDIKKKSSNVQFALNTLAMFGAYAKLSHLEVLEFHFDMKLLEPLKEAEGLVTNLNGSFHFCHDCIQEVSLNLIEEQYRRIKHSAYGKCLAKRALEANDNGMLFTAADQINLGGPSSIIDHSDYIEMANYNLEAGKQSMIMAEFSSALSYFMNGIAFLRDGHWQDHYSFSLEIFNLASKSSVAATKMSYLKVLSECVLNNARAFEDTIEIQFINMTVLSTSSPADSLDLGLSIVSKLGEETPLSRVIEEALDLKQIQKIIEEVGDPEEYFLNYKIMNDTKKLTVMRFLSRIQAIAYQVKPQINPLVILQMLQITITFGLSPAAPATFACFGSYLARQGDLNHGYKYALLGKALINKLGVYESSEVVHLVSEIQMYCQPAQASNQVRIQNQSSAISQGDMHWAGLIHFTYCNESVWVENNLASVSELFFKARAFLEQIEHKIALAFSLVTHQAVLVILGQDKKALELEHLLREMRVDDIPFPQLKTLLFFYKLYLSYLMNPDDLIECYEDLFKNEIEEHFLFFFRCTRTFFASLAAFKIYRQNYDSSWRSRGIEHKKEFQRLVEQGSSWNFEHKLQLLEAEDYYCRGDFEQATESYKKAISSAKAHKFINDEALACELVGEFFLYIDNQTSSLEYLMLAHEKYCEWGAHGKASQLFSFINTKFDAA